ncbi:fibronectin type III domain-containing protein [Candidatus Uhrbacteria bacterium]|nr:fibronectin type III domain-containing protein [Candidatus Uhrbacteria bacterium]
MKNKVIIVTVLLVIFILALGITFWTFKGNEPEKISWDGNLQTARFRPQQIAGEERGSSSFIRLTWQKPETIYNHFLITVANPETGWTRKESGEHERFSLDISDLEPDTLYTFVVQACGNPNCDAWITSKEVSDRTEKMFWKFTDEKISDDLPKKDEWEEVINFESSIFLTVDDKPWTENKNDWQIENVFVQSKPYKIILKLAKVVENGSGETLFAELLNP